MGSQAHTTTPSSRAHFSFRNCIGRRSAHLPTPLGVSRMENTETKEWPMLVPAGKESALLQTHPQGPNARPEAVSQGHRSAKEQITLPHANHTSATCSKAGECCRACALPSLLWDGFVKLPCQQSLTLPAIGKKKRAGACSLHPVLIVILLMSS